MKTFRCVGNFNINDSEIQIFNSEVEVYFDGHIIEDRGDRDSPPWNEYIIDYVEVVSATTGHYYFDKTNRPEEIYWDRMDSLVYNWLIDHVDQWVDRISIY